MSPTCHVQKVVVALIATLFLLNAKSAEALDAAKDRRGLFWGMGFGGNGDISIDDETQAGGGFNFDIQLGGGATRNLTLALDVDVTGVFFEKQQNIIFCPGPEINYFFGETGFFIRAGLAAVLSLVKVDGVKDDDFRAGFEAGAGFGWEFFVNSNLALGAALELDYMVRSKNDLMMFGFMFNLKYY
jgi:hypothetical protein